MNIPGGIFGYAGHRTASLIFAKYSDRTGV